MDFLFDLENQRRRLSREQTHFFCKIVSNFFSFGINKMFFTIKRARAVLIEHYIKRDAVFWHAKHPLFDLDVSY